MEKKYIHYCWFGNKPFPKLGKKCLESWKKFLPDYEIIKWSEDNVDLEECPFIKQAYENKKWAFVADYVRAKALKEYGGIYFDTDMEVIKNIDSLFESNTFLGIEDTGYVAVGVWYEKEKNSLLPSKLLEKYRSMENFDIENIGNISIPKMISEILDNYGLKFGSSEIQKLEKGIYIYPREYFYPYSYNREDNVFTDKTCMIHYYDASWIPLKERMENYLVRKIGKRKTFVILHIYRKIKDMARKIAKVLLFPLIIYRNKKRKKLLITQQYLNRVESTIKQINKHAKKEYIVIHNSEWMGVTSATKELFENTIDCGELYRKQDIVAVAKAITNTEIEQVIFSSFAIGYYELVKYLRKKKKDIKIKTYWHGSHSQILDSYGWDRNIEIIKLHKKKKVDVMASCKESLLNFYKKENYNAKFLTNKVETSVIPLKTKNNKEIKIGLYAAKCDDWRKNMFTQMAAVSLINNAVLDMVPLNETAKEFANIIGLKLVGEEKTLSREKLIERMSCNDVNLYVTFSECAPMLPLESFEMNVPCITGNNHHYFKNSELESRLVIKNEDNPLEIKEKLIDCIKNKKEILELYKEFNEKNKKTSKQQINDFIEM